MQMMPITQIIDSVDCREKKTIKLDSRFASLIKRIMTLEDGISQITIIKDSGEIKASFTKLGNVERLV